jgi:CBS domain-containing protein
MFAIHGVSGQQFRGSLEDMTRIRRLDRVRPPMPVSAFSVDSRAEFDAIPASHARKEALHAYRAMLPESIERGPLYHADQVMQRQVITLAADDNVAQAWAVLRDHRIHQAPVLDNTQQLIGIVSERDLLTAINIEDGQVAEPTRYRVREVMSTPVISADAVTDIRRIASVMLEQNVDGVPVTSANGHLIGFISRSDILRAVITDPPLSLWR